MFYTQQLSTKLSGPMRRRARPARGFSDPAPLDFEELAKGEVLNIVESYEE